MKRGIIMLLVFTCIFIASAAFAGTVQLPETGQIQGSDPERNGEDGDIKAGVPWPSPRLIVGSGAESQCVTDLLTGLMWTKHANLPYSTKQWQEALNYVASMNNGNGFCGYTDWRLPNRKELLTLVDHSKWGPSLPAGHPFTNVKTDGGYWSSTTVGSDTDDAWYIYLGTGCIHGDCKLSGSYVWPVRGGEIDNLITLSITRSGAGTGTVTAANIDCGTDCSQSYNPNTSRNITLTATADTDSIFTGWSGDCSGSANQVTITVDASKSCTASFAPGAILITVTGTGVNGGTVVENGSGIISATWNGTTMSGDNAETVNYGAGPYVITATTYTGKNVSWTGDCNATTGNGTVTATCTLSAGLSSNKNIIASFAANNYTVTPSIGGGSGHGTITPSAAGTISHGSATTFSVTPESSYTVAVGGTCGGTLTGTTYTTNAITSNCTVIAYFNIKSYPVMPTLSSGGTISPASHTVNHGSTATFTVTAGSGYTASISGTCGGQLSGPGSNRIYTTGPITGNCDETITFTGNGTCGTANGQTLPGAPATDLCGIGTASAVSGTGPWTWNCTGVNGGTTANCSTDIQAYTVTPTVSNGGVIEPVSRTVNHGSAAAFTVIANSGYTAGISGTCGGQITGSGSSITYTTGSITGNCSETITFIGNGSCGTANGRILTIAPATNLCSVGTASEVSGSGLWAWSCAGVNGGMTADCSASIQTYTIAPAVSSGGTISPASHTINHGGTAAFTVIAGSGYTASLSGDCGGQLSGPVSGETYTTGPITGYCSETITFIGNGTCGPANGQTLTAAPGTNLCGIGTASAVSGSGPWTWNCAGVNGGTSAECSAGIQTYTAALLMSSGGTAGPASRIVNHGSAASFAVTANNGYTVSISGTCGGRISGPDSDLTYTTGPVTGNCAETITFAGNGVCGTAGGQTSTEAPVTDLCAIGTASAVSGSGPWTWSCAGVNGGTIADCSANIRTYTIVPSVGNGGTIEPASRTVNHGTSAAFTVTADSGYRAGLSGSCGGEISGPGSGGIYTTGPITGNCSEAITFIGNGTCGSANGQTLIAAPATDLCGIGTPSAVSGSGPWTWSCTGVNGGSTTLDCSANIQTYTTALIVSSGGKAGPASRMVSHGSAAAFAVTADSGYTPVISGTCGGKITKSISGLTYTTKSITGDCAETITFIGNGACGVANGQTLTAAPANNLCSIGTASAVNGSGPWTWSCAGVNGSTIADCSAGIRTYTIVPSVGNGGTIEPASRIVNHGSAAMFTIIAGDGHKATISGTCGGPVNGPVYTTNAVTGVCTVIVNFTPNTYSLTINKEGSGSGTTTGSGLYGHGSTANVTATAAPGSIFTSWSGDCAGNSGETTLTIDGTKTCTATFNADASGSTANPKKYTLTIIKSGNGVLYGLPSQAGTLPGIDCGQLCSNVYDSGTEIELLSVPGEKMVLADWSVPGCMNTSNTCTIKMDADMEITVTFKPVKSKNYALKVRVQKGGTIISDDGNIDCDASDKAKTCTGKEHYYGGLVTLSAVPAKGHIFTGWMGISAETGTTSTGTTLFKRFLVSRADYEFSGWKGCTSKSGNICTVTMKKDTMITAKFRELKQYDLKAIVRKGGTVRSDDGNISCDGNTKRTTCKAKYPEGPDKSVTLTADSSTGYIFTGWSGGGCSGTGPCTVTMSASNTVIAKFKKEN